MNESVRKHKSLVIAVVFVVTAAAARWHGTVPPYDDLYHLKRIAAYPPLIELDSDRGERGAWCPWPPLYDVVMALLPSPPVMPVLGFAIFAATLASLIAKRAGLLAGSICGSVLAFSPYLIGISHRGAIDHHWVEPILLVAIVLALERRHPWALGAAMTAAMFVQTALLVAAFLAFAIAFFERQSRLAVSFAMVAFAIAVHRLTRPPGYPDSIWFLGWTHAALFAAAAIALFCLAPADSPARAGRIAGATLVIAPFLGTILDGLHFFHGDPWLRTIVEFQPMFRDPAAIGTDIANLTGGAVLAFALLRRERTIAIFAIAYFVLALTSRRFLVPGIALFAIAGALATVRYRWIAAAATLLPPLFYDAYAVMHPSPPDVRPYAIAHSVAALPPGRVLAPWPLGHAIDVIGKHPVVIDNFGSMPGEMTFAMANDALLQRHPDKLLAYMRERDIRYLTLTDPRSGLPAAAAAVGLDPRMYAGTKLGRSTVWWRLTHGEQVEGLQRVR